ncbi:MAG: hypothetical protein ACREDR_25440 [Blastocatellia bacterium]
MEVCGNPNFQGVDAALNINALRTEILQRYPMVDLFVLFVDRDGIAGRKAKTENIEKTLSGELPKGRAFFAEVAWQEAEIFILAGHSWPSTWKWKEMRADANVKNTFFKKLVKLQGTGNLPHEGRKKLMSEAMGNWRRIKTRCPEDVGLLIKRISDMP